MYCRIAMPLPRHRKRWGEQGSLRDLHLWFLLES